MTCSWGSLSLRRIRVAVIVVAAVALTPEIMPAECAGAEAASSVPFLDLDDQVWRQVVVDREAGQYIGHPTTVLLEDGKTMLCVYPKGHGRGPIVYKRSNDGGMTWSERLATPASWATSKETPTLHRVIDADGTKRIIMFSGLYPCRMAVTDDDGSSWSELKPVGDWGGSSKAPASAEVKQPASRPRRRSVVVHPLSKNPVSSRVSSKSNT